MGDTSLPATGDGVQYDLSAQTTEAVDTEVEVAVDWLVRVTKVPRCVTATADAGDAVF